MTIYINLQQPSQQQVTWPSHGWKEVSGTHMRYWFCSCSIKWLMETLDICNAVNFNSEKCFSQRVCSFTTLSFATINWVWFLLFFYCLQSTLHDFTKIHKSTSSNSSLIPATVMYVFCFTLQFIHYQCNHWFTSQQAYTITNINHLATQ